MIYIYIYVYIYIYIRHRACSGWRVPGLFFFSNHSSCGAIIRGGQEKQHFRTCIFEQQSYVLAAFRAWNGSKTRAPAPGSVPGSMDCFHSWGGPPPGWAPGAPPRRDQDAPQRPQDPAKPPQVTPKRPQDAPKTPQDAAKRPQEAAKTPPRGSKTPRDPPRTRPGPQKSLIFLRFL